MEATIRDQLARLAKGERVPMIAIGCFTEAQFQAINASRAAMDLHPLDQNEIVFMGRHLYASRSKDGYGIEDMVAQIVSAISPESVAHLDVFVSYTQNPNPRDDGYGNRVNDRAIFEMTARKPRAELYSVMPKGDKIKPANRPSK
jgi:hypothetical protein